MTERLTEERVMDIQKFFLYNSSHPALPELISDWKRLKRELDRKDKQIEMVLGQCGDPRDKKLINKLKESLDAANVRVKELEMCLDMANRRAELSKDIAEGAAWNVNRIREMESAISKYCADFIEPNTNCLSVKGLLAVLHPAAKEKP